MAVTVSVSAGPLWWLSVTAGVWLTGQGVAVAALSHAAARPEAVGGRGTSAAHGTPFEVQQPANTSQSQRN